MDRRRLQLWILALTLLTSLATALVLLTFWERIQPPSWVTLRTMQVGLLGLVALFCCYAIEKELHLRRLTRQLVREKVLTAALTNRLRELTTLLEAARAVNLVLDLKEVLQTILRCAMELLDGRDGSIMLVSGERLLRTVSVAGDSAAAGASLRFGEGIAGRVAATRDPVLISGTVEHRDRPDRVPVDNPPTSALSVPLIRRDTLVGVLNINAAPEREYTEGDLRALSLFAEQAAGAVSNAQLYESQRLLASRTLFQALHDTLTNLPNRALFLDRIEHALTRRRPEGELVGVLFVDLDDFKRVNDSLGHAAGDLVLCAFAERLRRCLRMEDTIARYGGDEFTVLVERIRSAGEATNAALRVRRCLEEPFDVHGRQVYLSSSIGIAIEGQGGSRPDELLRNADAAMHVAKADGKRAVEVFEPSMHADALGRFDLEAEMRGVVDRAELLVHYQPIFSLAERRARGVEALVRWLHPERGLLQAASFVPIAEQVGLLHEIDGWVLQTACSDVCRLRSLDPRLEGLSVHVNLSPARLHDPRVVDEIGEILFDTGLPPRQLTLEITERAILKNLEAAAAHLGAMKSLGVRIALDDFGTGYSSLSHLRELPVDAVKIDRIFVDGIEEDGNAAALVDAIIRLAQSLTIEVVAEGIERSTQIAHLRRLGCQLGQGNLLAAPVAAGELAAVLKPDSETS